MRAIEASIARKGGIARTAQLLAEKHEWDWLRIAAMYGNRIIHVRKGWWATADTHPVIIEARRAGGRLACVSALAMYEGSAPTSTVHIEVARHSSRRRNLLPAERAVVVHRPGRPSWGNEAVVSYNAARLQAAECRGLSAEAGER